MDTAGFYKNDGQLLYGPNSVTGPSFDLIKEDRHLYTYPVDGWYWFDSADAALEFFELPPAEPTP